MMRMIKRGEGWVGEEVGGGRGEIGVGEGSQWSGEGS